MSVTFASVIEQFGNHAGIPIPEAAIEELGGGRRPAVVAEIDGYVVRASLGSMGGRVLLAFSAAHRAASGFEGGRSVTVTLTLDTAPNLPSVPADLDAALTAEPGARAAFDSLAPSYQRNFVAQVESAKAPETRQRRIATTVARLLAGEKR